MSHPPSNDETRAANSSHLDTSGYQFSAALELRHRCQARCEDRIRNAKDTGLRNLPLKGFAQNQVW